MQAQTGIPYSTNECNNAEESVGDCNSENFNPYEFCSNMGSSLGSILSAPAEVWSAYGDNFNSPSPESSLNGFYILFQASNGDHQRDFFKQEWVFL